MKEQEFINQITLLKNRLNDNPSDLDAAVTLGNYYYDHGETALSLVYYGVALRLDPQQPHVQTDMASMYWKNGDLGLAEQLFNDVIHRFPDFVTAYLNLGLLKVRARGKVKEGRAIWSRVVEEFPEHEAARRARQLLAETKS